MHTVLSNRETGKIALLTRRLKAKELSMQTTHFEGKGFEVKTITRDLSHSYDWFCRTAFPNAGRIAGKFQNLRIIFLIRLAA
jgi:hypothetical protein